MISYIDWQWYELVTLFSISDEENEHKFSKLFLTHGERQKDKIIIQKQAKKI